MPSVALAISPQEWPTVREQALVALKSGFLPEAIRSPEQALAIIMKGRELGIPMMQALSSIVVIKGKPTANAELMAALIFRDHGDDALHYVKTDNQRCTMRFKRKSGTEYEEYSFTMDDAKAAGLLSNATWQKYPAAMLRARCISAIARMKFPDSIAGMYTPEEMGADLDMNEEGVLVIKDVPLPQTSTNKTERLEELFGPDVPEPVELGEFTESETVAEKKKEPINPEKWTVFKNWAEKKMFALGCAKPLVNNLVTELYQEGFTQGWLNDEDWLHDLSAKVNAFETSSDAAKYLNVVKRRNQYEASKETVA